ncbi:hypothetical protein P0F65_12370 [Sphingomonas sp. I4]
MQFVGCGFAVVLPEWHNVAGQRRRRRFPALSMTDRMVRTWGHQRGRAGRMVIGKQRIVIYDIVSQAPYSAVSLGMPASGSAARKTP